MTTYEALNLVAQFSLILIAVLSFIVSIVVFLYKKK
ncbi:putative holin-like toxin [Oceanobacillus longus]|uniref:Holin-like toxin n=1 Tax=Oceanobacillus longus TaxID=930120 RepID=A0ABV8GUR5_9BACI